MALVKIRDCNYVTTYDSRRSRMEWEAVHRQTKNDSETDYERAVKGNNGRMCLEEERTANCLSKLTPPRLQHQTDTNPARRVRSRPVRS